MVLGVRLHLGLPGEGFITDSLAVLNSAHLDVASAKVDANAATLQVARHPFAPSHIAGAILIGAALHLEGMLIHSAHKVLVKGTGASGGIGLTKLLPSSVAAADGDLPAAPHPQQAFHQPVHIQPVRLAAQHWVTQGGLIHGDLTAATFHRNGKGMLRLRLVGAEEQTQRHKVPVQLRYMAALER